MISKILSDPIKVRNELQKIADELGLPIEDEKVLRVWSKESHPYTDEVFEKVFKPLYFTKKRTMTEIREILENHCKILP